MTAVEKYLIRENRSISSYFDRTAEGLDRFLSGRRNEKLRNRSRVVLEGSAYSRESEGVSSEFDVKINLHLPNLEEHWALKFSSYDENEDLRDTQNRYLRRAPREQNYGTSIVAAGTFGAIRTRYQPRIELSDPLKISHLLRFESEAQVSRLKIAPKLEFFARPKKGTGVFAGLTFDLPMGERLLFTQINGHEYQAFGSLFSSSNGVSISQALTDRISMAYSVMFYSSSRPSYHLDNYAISTTWSQILYRNIVHFQVIPLIDFAKVRAFKGQTGIVLNVQLIF